MIELPETPFSFTPHLYISGVLAEQKNRTREAAVAQLVEAFDLEEFDANTIALAAADLGQIRDAIKRVRIRRYGAIEVRYIELDVVTWHILPSPENVRFEDSRVRASSSAPRYGSLSGGAPVLTLAISSEQQFVTRLDGEIENIWITNDHSQSIPSRGIENPGLLSVARILSPEHGRVGILDATDGFGRTVGAHKALRVTPSEVLWKLSNADADQTLRRELIGLRTNPHDESDTTGVHLSDENRERLRGSVMLRAQVIVGYTSSQRSQDSDGLTFDQVRRKMVGHIHIEPAKPFSLGTQYALKATAAVEALDATQNLPAVPEFDSSEVASIFWADSPFVAETETTLSDGRRALRPDEVFVTALAALRGSKGRNDRRARITNAAIRDLTGQTPSRADRLMLASDLALRLGELASGSKADDPSYEPRRSSLDRAIRPKLFDAVELTREPIQDVLDLALLELAESKHVDVESQSRPSTAELASLALFHLLGRPGRRLLERATRRDSAGGNYISEPNVVIEGLTSSRHGLVQLAQVVLDGRAGRQPQKVEADADLVDSVIQGGTLLDPEALRALTGDSAASGPLPESPQSQLNTQVTVFKQEVRNLIERIASISSIKSGEDAVAGPLVLVRGAAVAEEAILLQDAVYRVRPWADRLTEHVENARAASLEADRAALDQLA